VSVRFLFCVVALCLFVVSCDGGDDSVALEPSTAAGAESVVVADILWRRFQNQQGTEIVACREMAADFGLYRGDVLVDDLKPANPAGFHGITVYTIERQSGQWFIDNAEGGTYADCFGDRWLEVVNEWQPDPVTWEVLHVA